MAQLRLELWEDAAGSGEFSLTLKYFNGLPQPADGGHGSRGAADDDAAAAAAAGARRPTGTLEMPAASFVQRWL